MERLRITHANPWNWYHVGEVYSVRSKTAYSNIGVQVFREGQQCVGPDVVSHGDFVFIDTDGNEII